MNGEQGRLSVLVWNYIDGVASDAEVRELGVRLAEDPEARGHFVECALLDCSIRRMQSHANLDESRVGSDTCPATTVETQRLALLIRAYFNSELSEAQLRELSTLRDLSAWLDE